MSNDKNCENRAKPSHRFSLPYTIGIADKIYACSHRHKRTAGKCAAVKNLADGRFEFGAHWLVMGLQI